MSGNKEHTEWNVFLFFLYLFLCLKYVFVLECMKWNIGYLLVCSYFSVFSESWFSGFMFRCRRLNNSSLYFLVVMSTVCSNLEFNFYNNVPTITVDYFFDGEEAYCFFNSCIGHIPGSI